MRLLIISYFYPPAVSPRAFRWGALAAHWRAQGHQVDVVSAGGALEQAAATASPLLDAARWLYRSLYWPDAGMLWLPAARRQTRRLLNAHRYDGVISVAPFFTAHLVAASLKQGGVRWLADNGDPFFYPGHNNVRLYRPLNRFAERRVFRAADAISVTTEPTRRIYAEMFPETADKIAVIPPLLSLPPDPPDEPYFPDDDRIRLVYLGKLYARIRRPDLLLAALDGLSDTPLGDRVELHVFGDVSEVAATFSAYAHLPVYLHGVVPREEAIRAMWSADVLVNIGNRTAYQLPSKVVEYANTGKRVLNIASVPDDSSAAFFRDYPPALTLWEGQPLALDRLADFLRTPPPPFDAQAWVAPYRIEAVAAAYMDLLVESKSGAAGGTA